MLEFGIISQNHFKMKNFGKVYYNSKEKQIDQLCLDFKKDKNL